MSRLSRRVLPLLVTALALWTTRPASAQTLGTFQWTLQPFCNVVTASVTATETGYTLDGWDDQCGASRKAPLVGQASANPDGTLTLGFYIVTAPVVKALAVEATVNPTSRAGTWRDSEGHTGTFAVGAQAGGSARPAPSALVGAAAIDPSEVQRRVSGACPADQFFNGVNQDGSAVCATPAGGGDITDIVAGPGLTGGAGSGSATLSVDFNQVALRDHNHAPSYDSVVIGDHALPRGSNTSSTVAVGYGALGANVDGHGNTSVGAATMGANVSGFGNVALGANALNSIETGVANTAIGWGAMNTATGSAGSNTAVGSWALNSARDQSNVAVGSFAMSKLRNGSFNVGIGNLAGNSLTNGSDNVYLGSRTGGGDESFTMRLGRDQTRSFIAGIRGVTTGANDAIPVVIDSNGQLGTVSSSARTKFDIGDLPTNVTNQLQQLRPVQFRYTQPFANGTQPLQYGLIAEEVQQVLPELVAMGKDGTPETVKYHVLPALLLAEVQRLSRELAELRSLLEAERAKR